MKRGRPPKGEKLVEELDGSEHAKVRTRVVLETITGKKTVQDACLELGIKEARFHEMRQQALAGMVESLEPKTAGRPPNMSPEEALQIGELKDKVRSLKEALNAAQTREELAREGLLAALEPEKKKEAKKRRKKSW